MKFRKLSTHEFCVTNALGLEADCLHKVPLFGFFSLSVRKRTPFKIFPWPFTASHLKLLFSFSRSQRAVQNNSLAVQMKFDLLAHLVA